MKSAAYWVDNLNLQAHPEGGFYKETYRSGEVISTDGLPSRFKGDRNLSTAIYFLLRSQDRSVFHRIKSDELWHYYAGSALHNYVLMNDSLVTHKLGPRIEQGETLQVVIPAGCWFGAKVVDEETYTLAGCTVSPGFDFRDFEIADRENLHQTFPGHRNIIDLLT